MAPEAAPMAVVKRTIHIRVPIEKAFRVFTEKMGMWWPTTHRIGPQPYQDVIVEPRTEGRWFERGGNGVESDWGRVLIWEPPHRLLLAWHLQQPDWKFHPDPARASEVALEFFAEGLEATRMEFEHRHIERHGEGWQVMREKVDSPGGWTAVLAGYEAVIRNR